PPARAPPPPRRPTRSANTGRPRRPGSRSSTRPPSICTANRPHSWTLALDHPLIRWPSIRKGRRKAREGSRQPAAATIGVGNARQPSRGGAMAAATVGPHRPGHEAFNRRDFAAMTAHYADRIRWTDRARGLTFTTPGQFREEFLAGWVQASTDIRITDPAYLDAGRAAGATFAVTGTHE